MSKTIELTITESERAQLEALLDLCLQEMTASEERHQRLSDQWRTIAEETRRTLAEARWRLMEAPGGQN
jgi:hypothetical protein